MEKHLNPEDIKKLRGGYYTPSKICSYLASWAITDGNEMILEPSCGDGEFVYAAVERLLDLNQKTKAIKRQVNGIEFNTIEAVKAGQRVRSSFQLDLNIINEDFFSQADEYIKDGKKFDVVLGNPPFIRYQNFKEEHREIAFRLLKNLGQKPNKLTNAWAPFVTIAASLLSENGKMAMVIPSELYQVSYAEETRKFLLEHFQNITLINFKELLFEGAQQEVILFLGEKRPGEKKAGIEFLEFKDVDEFVSSGFNSGKIKPKFRPVLQNDEKWTKYYLEPNEIELMRKVGNNKNVVKTANYFEVDVGVVTGQNKFFVLKKDIIEEYGIEKSVIPCITRTNLLQGLSYNKSDWKKDYNSNKSSSLFLKTNLDVENKSLTNNEKKYIKYGEEQNFHSGYKCSIRKNWFCVPSIWIPDAFFLRQVHKYPKIVLNSAKACPTDTIHRVKFAKGYCEKTLSLAFLNSMTFAHSEIMGRSYGGGVLTFEPSEAEKLLFPKLDKVKNIKLPFEEIELLLRQNRIEDVLDITDQIVLGKIVGLSKVEIEELRAIWIKLRDRRVGRKFSENIEDSLIH